MSDWKTGMPKDLNDNAQFLAILTDCVLCGFVHGGVLITDGSRLDENRILEIRVFTEQKEFRAFREYVQDDFKFRVLDDTGKTLKQYYDVYDETQLLDIIHSETVTGPGGDLFTAFTTEGGGTCSVPGADVTKVLLRTYLEEDPSNGLSWAGDWRIVKIEK